jgi:signal transduction histidine kinase
VPDRRPSLLRRVRPRSVRARTTALATAVVVLALAVGATALLLVLRHALVEGVDDAARLRALDLAALAAADGLPATITAGGEDDVAQVVDDSGRVLSGTANVAGQGPVATFRPGGDVPVVRTMTLSEGGDLEEFRVWAVRRDTSTGPVTAYVGASLEAVSETVAVVQSVLAVGLPLLLLVLALSAWVAIGRALRPVESVRREVAAVTGAGLDRRVGVPATSDEVSRLATTMNEMLDRLVAFSRRQQQFVGDASHELQSPLAGFRAQLEVALDDPAGTDWPDVGRDLLSDTQRMEGIVRDLLFLARTDEGADLGPVTPVDLDDVVLEEVSRVRPATSVALRTDEVSAAPVRGNRTALSRLVRNLLDNAVRHADSAVTVRLAARDGECRLVVEDDGPGVPRDRREVVFDRFVRADEARSRRHGGAGLGLAIVRSVAERHGGSVTVDDAEPTGARFVVRLPLAPAPTGDGLSR